MLYKVEAKFYESKAREFLGKLRDGTIERQEPDGREIVASMERAKLGEDEIVRWTETCFCNPPLAHEKTTVYDKYFYDMMTWESEECKEIEGKSFMDYLSSVK